MLVSLFARILNTAILLILIMSNPLFFFHRFLRTHMKRMAFNQKFFFHLWMCTSWLTARLEISTSLILFSISILCVSLRSQISPVALGLALTYGLQLNALFQRVVQDMYLHTSQKCWEWQLDDLDNKQDVQGVMVIKWVHQCKWPAYYSSHYCINAMKQYRCIAKIRIILYCNMANRSSFARYCCIIISMTVDHCCFLVAFVVWNYNHEYISLMHKSNIVELIDCRLYND